MNRRFRPWQVLTAALFAACNSAAEPDLSDVIGSLAVSPAELTLGVGQTRQLSATVFSVTNIVLANAAVSWTSSDESTATVDNAGRATGVGAGTVSITARSGGKSAAASVHVTASMPADGDVVIDAGTVYQQITGWEAAAWTGQWSCGGGYPTSLYDRYAPEVFDGAVDLGINRLRLELRAGAERPTDLFPGFTAGTVEYDDWRATWYDAVNDNGSASSINPAGFQFSEMDLAIERVVQPLRQRLAARGEALYVNLNFIDFRRNTSFEHHVEPEEYAELILAAFQHIRSRWGWVPDAVEIILEPDNGSPDWTGAQIGSAIVATGNRLKAAGFSPDFIAPSGASAIWTRSVINQVVAVPGALQYLSELSYHRYSVSAEAIAGIADLAAQSGVRTSMLEHIGSGHEDLHEDLELGRISAWQQFALAGCAAGDPGGRHFLVDASNPANPTVTLASRSHFLRQYFRWVRAGAVRVGATSSIAALHPLAFINADGGYVVVVKTDGARDFTIGGLPAGEYGVAYTTGPNETSPQQSGVELAPVTIGAGEALSTGIPGRGVITIYAK
jgi:hypothetical protein